MGRDCLAKGQTLKLSFQIRRAKAERRAKLSNIAGGVRRVLDTDGQFFLPLVN